MHNVKRVVHVAAATKKEGIIKIIVAKGVHDEGRSFVSTCAEGMRNESIIC